MFFMITNIYNKQTKWPTIMELFIATGKLKKFFWKLDMFDVCTTGDTAHIDKILATHASTWAHRYSSLLQWSVPARSRRNGGTYYYVIPLSPDLADLKARIIAAVKNIDAPMLTGVWQELEYRIDVCRVTRGAHVEHFYLSKKTFFSISVAVNNSIKVVPLVYLLKYL
jgi:hypothetical protein